MSKFLISKIKHIFDKKKFYFINYKNKKYDINSFLIKNELILNKVFLIR
ncbi:hypothetical protein [Candidatus Vidania fulgoroideorum]